MNIENFASKLYGDRCKKTLTIAPAEGIVPKLKFAKWRVS